MDEEPRGRPIQFDLQTLFWLTFVICILCVVVPMFFGWRPWVGLGERARRGELNGPVILGVVIFAVVRWLISRDRPGRRR